jgi:hypothetical protein
VPRGDFTSGRAYVQKWNLPRPAEVTGAVAAEGDLVSAIGAQENVAEQTPKEDEVDDIELMNAILGVPPTTPTA